MKLIIFLSVAILVRCDYPTAEPETSSEPHLTENGQQHSVGSSIAPIDTTQHIHNFPTIYNGAFPLSSIPPVNFLSSFSLPQLKISPKPVINSQSQISFVTTPQGVLPPLSEIFPPISQIVPPIFGGSAKPSLPIKPPQIVPPPGLFPSKPNTALGLQLPKYTYNYKLPYYHNPLPQYYYNKTPFSFPFPSHPFFSSISTFQKEPIKIKEPMPSGYGPPSVESSSDFEQSAESSSSFDPSSASYPYEPAVPETPEPAPYKPAQEYGPPNKK